jgi:membrane peptidoglycan carboxypeptidase
LDLVEKKIILDNKTMDKRVIEQMIQTGKITAEEMNTYLESLPDVSENAEEIIVDMERKRK